MASRQETDHEAVHEAGAVKEPVWKRNGTKRKNEPVDTQPAGTEDTYRLLLENLNEVVYALDDKAVITYISPSIERLSGYTPEELIGKLYIDLVYPEDRQNRYEQFRNILTDRGGPSEYRFCIKDGTSRWIRTNAKAVFGGGRVIGIQGTLIDITDRKQAEEALRQSEEKYRHIFEKAGEGILVARSETCKFVNPALERILGYPMETITSEPFVTFIHPDDQALVTNRHHRRMQGESPETGYDFRIIRPDGAVRWVTIQSQVIEWEGEPANLAFIMDITDRKRAEEALRQSEEMYRTFVENASDIVFWTDENGYFTFVNPVALRITGYGEKELLGKHYLTLIREDMRDEVTRFFGRQFVKKLHNTYSEYPFLTKDGDELWLGQNTQLILTNDRVAGFQAVARNITDMRQTKEKIHQMAYHDALTGLPNRLLFSDRLDIALAQAGRHQAHVAVIMLDLDYFKDVNDTLGHDAGDVLLKQAADRLSALLRKSDTVARFGGDEFVLILLDLKEENDVIPVAEKIVESFRRPFLIDSHELTVTASVGIAVYPQGGEDETMLMKNADIAMYDAKKAGRDRYLIYRDG
ncbi:MAG: PAS domain S-box protein [Syntrophales bacterium]|jgi:diguanylate cyclase (GGDEF)-like protein/PAS domain S-box-containing protein|nr:PAS domain S-box protein [Syntrophales bacterium]MDX9921990.1 PAS domain S-box protein [Syntrophales bacterium]